MDVVVSPEQQATSSAKNQQAGFQLRPLSQSDKTLVVSLYSHPEVMRHIAPPLTKTQAEDKFDTLLSELAATPKKREMWVLEHPEAGDLGLVGYSFRESELPTAEIGIMLKPFIRNRAVRRVSDEGLNLAAKYFWSTAPNGKVIARIDPNNLPASKLVIRLGFEQVCVRQSEKWHLWELYSKEMGEVG